MRGDSVYIIYRYRDLGFLDLFTYMSSCSTFRFRRTRTGSYRETASPMLNFPASHSVWQFLETARPTLNLPVRTDGPTAFSTSVYDYTQTPQCKGPFSIILLHTNDKLAGLYLHGSPLCKADSLALVSKDLQNTFRFHKIKSPLTSISLNKLKDLAADRVVWRGEIARGTKP